MLLFPLPKEQGDARQHPRAGSEQRAVPRRRDQRVPARPLALPL